MKYRSIILFCCTSLSTMFGSEPVNGPDLTITSDALQIKTEDGKTHFHFQRNVRLQKEDLVLNSDTLNIISRQGNNEGTQDLDNLESVVASGNVVLTQTGRVLKAGTAEFIPKDNLIVFKDNPTLTDDKGVLQGHQIWVNQAEQKVWVESDPQGNQRSTVTLKNFKALESKVPQSSH